MKLGNLFKKTRYVTVSTPPQKSGIEAEKQIEQSEQKPNIPDGMWVKCEKCGNILYKKDLEEQMMVCSGCKTHLRMTAWDRLSSIIDEETFEELNSNLTTLNPLDYPLYEEKIEKLKAQTELNEAVVTGKGNIYGSETVICVMDSRFMMASMGSVVGEKITRAVETATKERLPIIIFTASGGARMQEGIYSLMQMAKVSAALAKHSEEGLLYITVLTDPTTGGVTASFAMLGDIIISEPGALIGFAGRRVIEQTVKEKLPEGFQRAEFLLQHGFIDCIVERSKMKETISNILKLHVRR